MPNISTCTPTVEEMESDKERGRRRPFLKLITATETLQNTQGQSTNFYFQSRTKNGSCSKSLAAQQIPSSCAESQEKHKYLQRKATV